MEPEVIEDGALRIKQTSAASPVYLVVVHPCSSVPGRYWVEYVQSPERGRPGGGSSAAWTAEQLRQPATVAEHLLVQTYLTAKRVNDLRDELAEAEADAAAMVRLRALIGATDG